MTLAPNTPLRAAFIKRPHGVKGVLRVESLGRSPEEFANGLRLQREADGAVLTVTNTQPLPDGDILLHTAEITSRNDAELWRNTYLLVDAQDRRQLGENQWFVDDLVGLQAVNVQGIPVGKVTQVESYVGNDVLVIDEDKRVPLAHEFVGDVDLTAGTIVVNPPEETE